MIDATTQPKRHASPFRLFVVVNQVISAQCLQPPELRIGRRGRDHGSTGGFGELKRKQ